MATPPGVMAGGRLVRLRYGPGGVSDDIYAVIYEFPKGSGTYISYQFDSLEQATATLGNLDHWFSGARGDNTRTQAWWDKNVLATGNAEEIIGSKDTFSHYMERIQQQAADKAGVRDPGLAGRIANNKEMQQIMAQAIAGEWTAEQTKAAQRNTNFWKKELYPGIENLYDRTSEPEKAYADYMNQVTPALQALGYEPGADGTFKNQISKMLNKKIDSNVFLSQVPTFIQAKQNAEFAGILNQWAKRDLGRNIGFNDWFSLMAGESQPELEQVAERAQLEWVAQNQGTQLTQGEIEGIAGRTQLDPAEAQRAFSEFNQGILSLGDEGLKKYGLSRDEVLSAAVGVQAQGTERTLDETKLLVAKTARELGLADDEKINFYVGFNPQGTPNRPGLQTLRPEGA